MTYWKINADPARPTFEPVEIPTESNGFLKACYRAIGCDYIEVTPTCIRGLVLIVDEEGKLKDNWQVNQVATAIHARYGDPIAGDAILAREDDADLLPPTEKDMERLRAFFP